MSKQAPEDKKNAVEGLRGKKSMQRSTPPKKTAQNASEEMITEAICQYLSLFKGAQLNRITPSGFFKGGVMKKHRSKFVQRGMSDIQFVYRKKFYAFEVKTPAEYKFWLKHQAEIRSAIPSTLSKKKFHLWEQWQYLRGVRENGFIGEFVCSPQMIRKILEGK